MLVVLNFGDMPRRLPVESAALRVLATTGAARSGPFGAIGPNEAAIFEAENH